MSRTPCVILGCRCSTREQYKEWVCQKHWSKVPRSLRQRYNAAKRLARRIIRRKPLYREWWKLQPGSSERFAAIRLWKRLDTLWARCRDAAQDAEVGLL